MHLFCNNGIFLYEQIHHNKSVRSIEEPSRSREKRGILFQPQLIVLIKQICLDAQMLKLKGFYYVKWN